MKNPFKQLMSSEMFDDGRAGILTVDNEIVVGIPNRMTNEQVEYMVRACNSHESMLEALKELTHCPTCDGTGIMSLDCLACDAEQPHSICKHDEETCAQCDGYGRDFQDKDKVRRILEAFGERSQNPANAPNAAQTTSPEVTAMHD